MQATVKQIAIVGDEENMALNATLAGTPGENPEDMEFDVWFSWFDEEGGKQDNKLETSFNFTGETAIALRDFLISCFPLDGKT